MMNYIGSYRIMRQLGEGAFGVVYLAFQPFLDRPVAIKTLHTDLTSDSKVEYQFMQEARVISRLRHPNIVTVYEFGTILADPKPITFMVMEYLSGETLNVRLKHDKPDVAEIVSIMEKLADGLDYAHAHQIIHRDLKPGNIIFTDTGDPVIVDFGLAQLIELSSAEREPAKVQPEDTMSGTPAYMAPEQIAGEATGPATDQYALAIIAYQLLTGRLPHESDDIGAQLLKRLEEPPTPLRSVAPDFSAHTEQVLQTALARKPEQRFPNATQFARELGDALLPDRRRVRVVNVSDPVQAAQLRAARQTLVGFLWGIAAITLVVILFCLSLFVRGYSIGSPSDFVWEGLVTMNAGANTSVVAGIWPGSAAEKAGYRLRDVYKNDDFTVNGVPASELALDWQPHVNDVIQRNIQRNGQNMTLTFTIERSNYLPVTLIFYIIPTLVAFGCALLLLRRWGPEPGLQIFFLLLLATGFAMISEPLSEIIPFIGDIPDFILLPALLHFILIFPEPVKFAEEHPRRLWFLYLPVFIALAEFLFSTGILIGGKYDINLIMQLIYALVILAAVLLKWIRHDLKLYPSLWWMISSFLVGIVLLVIVTINPALDLNTILSVYGSRVTMRLIDFGLLSIGISISTILGTIAYHRLQKSLGPSFITQTSTSGKEVPTLRLEKRPS